MVQEFTGSAIHALPPFWWPVLRHGCVSPPQTRGVPLLVTHAEWEHPTAGLQPDVIHVHLRPEHRQDGDDGPVVFPHGLGDRLDHHVKEGLCVSCQRCGLGRVPGQIEQQGRVVVGDQLSRALAVSGRVAGLGTGRLEYGGHVVDLPHCMACMREDTSEVLPGHPSYDVPRP